MDFKEQNLKYCLGFHNLKPLKQCVVFGNIVSSFCFEAKSTKAIFYERYAVLHGVSFLLFSLNASLKQFTT